MCVVGEVPCHPRVWSPHLLPVIRVSPGDMRDHESQEAARGESSAPQLTSSFQVRNGRLREGSASWEVTEQVHLTTRRPRSALWALTPHASYLPCEGGRTLEKSLGTGLFARQFLQRDVSSFQRLSSSVLSNSIFCNNGNVHSVPFNSAANGAFGTCQVGPKNDISGCMGF